MLFFLFCSTVFQELGPGKYFLEHPDIPTPEMRSSSKETISSDICHNDCPIDCRILNRKKDSTKEVDFATSGRFRNVSEVRYRCSMFRSQFHEHPEASQRCGSGQDPCFLSEVPCRNRGRARMRFPLAKYSLFAIE